MYKKSIVLIAVAAIITVTASAQKLVLPKELEGSTEMKVKGRQGWQFNQVIRFGDFNTSKIRRGWTKGYDVGFTLRFRKAQEKLSFTQYTPDGREAEVLAVSRFQNTEYELLNGFLSYPLHYENTFAGTIIPKDSSNNAWEFLIYNPEGTLYKDGDCGRASDEKGNHIYIHGIQEIEGMPRWMMGAYFGFEFIRGKETVAAISTINNGKVWMKEGLDPETKLVVAALATSLLVRHDVSQAISSR